MFKKYVLGQMTQLSAYVGLFLMIAALFNFPHTWIFFAGLALLFGNDKWCEQKLALIVLALKDYISKSL